MLYEFNGGASCLQLYLNQHNFFLSNADIAPPKDDLVLVAKIALLPEWARDPPPIDAQLDRLLQEIIALVKSEWEVILQVFPNAVYAMQAFVQRIFALTVNLCF